MTQGTALARSGVMGVACQWQATPPRRQGQPLAGIPSAAGDEGGGPKGESARWPRSGHFVQQSGKGDWPDAQRLPAG